MPDPFVVNNESGKRITLQQCILHNISIHTASAAVLTDDKLESIVQALDYRQWQNLAIKLHCPADDVYEKEQTAQVFIRWRRQQDRNVNVIKYMAQGLRSIGRQNLADQLERK